MSKQLRPLGLFGDPTGRETVAGFSNHSICLQIPIELLTSNGRRPSGPTDPTAVVGIYANAMRPMIKVLRNDGSSDANGPLVQVSRLAIHSLWNSTSQPMTFNTGKPSSLLRKFLLCWICST